MKRSVVVINGNPACKRHSLCATLADACVEGASKAGAEVARYDLKDLSFDPILHEGYEENQALEPDLQTIRESMVKADHFIFIFPLWHAMPPALFKGFIDRVITRGFAFEYKDGYPVALPVFERKTAEIIITCSMPTFVYHWFSGAHATKALSTILKMCKIKVLDVTACGQISMKGPKAERRFKRYIKNARSIGAKCATK